MNHLGFGNENFERNELAKFKSDQDRYAGKTTRNLSLEDVYALLVDINSRLKRIEEQASQNREKRLSWKHRTWLFNEDLLEMIPVSSRTLQTYRDMEVLPFGKLGNICFYKKSDVEKMLEERYNKKKKKDDWHP